jgi:hypothetical protein
MYLFKKSRIISLKIAPANNSEGGRKQMIDLHKGKAFGGLYQELNEKEDYLST